MDKCPKCGKWLVEYDFQSNKKHCYSNGCDYKEYYCPEKWLLEHDCLHDCLSSLLSKKNDIKGRCRDYWNAHLIEECLSCECMPEKSKELLIKHMVISEL